MSDPIITAEKLLGLSFMHPKVSDLLQAVGIINEFKLAMRSAAAEIDRLNMQISDDRADREARGTCPEAYWEQRALSAEAKLAHATSTIDAMIAERQELLHKRDKYTSGGIQALLDVRAALDPEVRK